MKNDKFKNTIRYLPLAFIISFIWIQSMIPGEESTVESEFIKNIVTPILEIIVGKGNVTLHLVRKLAHFTEYFILGVISVITINNKKKIVLSSVLGLIVAIVDETIQLFTPGRSGMIKDVILDFSGVAFSILIMTLVIFICHKEK